MFYLFIISILSILGSILSLFLHYREKKDIFDRFMAKNYGEYIYFKQMPKSKKVKEEEEEEPLIKEGVPPSKDKIFLKEKAKEF